jgi:hypothetical protein
MTIQTSIGSTRNASQQAPSPKATTKVPLGSPRRYRSVTGASWSSTTAERPALQQSTNKPLPKKPWQGGTGR